MPSALLMIIALGAVMMVVPLSVDTFLPSLPALANDIGVSIDAAEGSLAIFVLTLGVGQLVFGPLSDLYGRRIIIFTGLILFTLASFATALVDTLGWIYVLRGLQGFGAASAVAILPFARDRFSGNRATQIMSAITAFTLLGPLAAPFIGSYLTIKLGWPSIFVMLGMFGILGLIMMSWLQSVMREHIEENPIKRPSLVQIGKTYRAILTDRNIMIPSLISALGFGGIFAFISGASYVYLDFFSISEFRFAAYLAIIQTANISANLLNMVISEKLSPLKRFVISIPLLCLTSMCILATAYFGASDVMLMISVAAFFFMFGLMSINGIAHIMSIRPKDNGSIIAVNGALRFLIGAIASAIVSVIAARSAVPMAAVLAVFSLIALVLGAFTISHTEPDNTSP